MDLIEASESEDLPKDEVDIEDKISNSAIISSDPTMVDKSTCCIQNERISSSTREAGLENTYTTAVLDIIKIALSSHKWFEKNMGMFNCQLCKCVSMESTKFITHISKQSHLERLKSGKNLFEKKMIIFKLLDDLDLCKVEITALDPNNFSDAVYNRKITKRNFLKALHLATLAIRSEEEEIDSYAKEQLLQKKTNLEDDVRKVAEQASLNKTCFAELLAILNKYHWHQQEESGRFRCLLCGTKLSHIRNFILHLSSEIHLDNMGAGNNVIDKKKILLNFLGAVNDCAFKINNFDLQNTTSLEASGFKRRIEKIFKKVEEEIKEKLLSLEEREENNVIKRKSEENTIKEESASSLFASHKKEISVKEAREEKNHEVAIDKDRSQRTSEDKNIVLTEQASSNSFIDKKDYFERNHFQAAQFESHVHNNQMAIESQLLQIIVKHNLWPEMFTGSSSSCNLCTTRLSCFENMFAHCLGERHLNNLLAGNSISKREEILREMYNNISNCVADFKAINIVGYDKLEFFFGLMYKAKSRLVRRTWPRVQPILDSTTTATIILDCLKQTGRFLYSVDKFHCQICNMYFSPPIFNFISHIADISHIKNKIYAKKTHGKKESLRVMYERLLECESIVTTLNIQDVSMKEKILLSLNEAMKALDTIILDVFPESHTNSCNFFVEDIILEILVRYNLLPKKTEEYFCQMCEIVFCQMCEIVVSDPVESKLAHALSSTHINNLYPLQPDPEKMQTRTEIICNMISNCEADIRKIITNKNTKVRHLLTTAKSIWTKMLHGMMRKRRTKLKRKLLVKNIVHESDKGIREKRGDSFIENGSVEDETEERTVIEENEMREHTAAVGNFAHPSDCPINLTCKNCKSAYVVYNGDIRLSYDIHVQDDYHQAAVMKPAVRSSQEAAQIGDAVESLQRTSVDETNEVVPTSSKLDRFGNEARCVGVGDFWRHKSICHDAERNWQIILAKASNTAATEESSTVPEDRLEKESAVRRYQSINCSDSEN